MKKKTPQAICAKVDNEPCCDWVGETGAGHYVKMVHNGIEYGDMQLICEAYHIMRDGLKMTPQEMSDAFDEWNKGELESYLIEITRDILRFKDEKGYVLERIRDSAGQKGTGKWTLNSGAEHGIPVTLIGESVFARCLSALKDERVHASAVLKRPPPQGLPKIDRKAFLVHLRKALYASKIISYAQGFMLLREAAKVHNWNLNYGGIALMWRGGCIIRSVFLGNIKQAFDKNPNLSNLLLDEFFTRALEDCYLSMEEVLTSTSRMRIPRPALNAAKDFYDGYTSASLPANLLQALRDYFGAHTYEVLGAEGKFVHTNWTGHGGNVSASTYDA